MISKKILRTMLSLFIILPSSLTAQPAYKCLHIMSYHKGYAWNDGIEKGVEKTLKDICILKKFYMDTKRHTSPQFAMKKAAEVKAIISAFKPDIVIASDDNASKYVVTEYKNAKLPFIFNGINWTAEPYGFPYKNVTGMVEVAPIIPLLNIIRNNVNHVKKGVYISADVITEHKDFEHYKNAYEKQGVILKPLFVKSMDQWIKAYISAQSSDFIVLNNYAGIHDWNPKLAIDTAKTVSKVLTVTNYKWMMPFTMLALTKNAQEQGRWAAKVAIEVLSGTEISSIPITINQEWQIFVNYILLEKANIKLDANTQRSASTNW